MRLLLDSHVVLWWLADHDRLGPNARQAIAEVDEVHVSVVTLWELGIKRALGKLDFPDGLVDEVRSAGFVELPITAEHAVAAPDLPGHHRDPFDRMLLAQAGIEALTIVTADRSFGPYDAPLLDAGT